MSEVSLAAACDGRDLREDLTVAEREDLMAKTAAMPYARSISWTATRGSRQLHIIGTIHLSDQRLTPMAARGYEITEAPL